MKVLHDLWINTKSIWRRIKRAHSTDNTEDRNTKSPKYKTKQRKNAVAAVIVAVYSVNLHLMKINDSQTNDVNRNSS